MAIGQVFAAFLEDDPLTLPLPVPAVSSDRLPVVRSGGTYYAPPEVMAGTIPDLSIVTPVTGDTVVMAAGVANLYVNTAALADLTIRLPPGVAKLKAEVCFAATITNLAIQDAAAVTVPTAPTSGFGPGAALVFMYASDVIGWVYWK